MLHEAVHEASSVMNSHWSRHHSCHEIVVTEMRRNVYGLNLPEPWSTCPIGQTRGCEAAPWPGQSGRQGTGPALGKGNELWYFELFMVVEIPFVELKKNIIFHKSVMIEWWKYSKKFTFSNVYHKLLQYDWQMSTNNRNNLKLVRDGEFVTSWVSKSSTWRKMIDHLWSTI